MPRIAIVGLWSTRYSIARTPEEALSAAAFVEDWINQIAELPDLGHEAAHAARQALVDLRVVRTFLRRLDAGVQP